MIDNNINPLEKIYIDTEIGKLKQEELAPLVDRVECLTGALVETKASLISQVIYFHCVVTFKLKNNSLADIKTELKSTLEYLRGSIKEGALPEDAYPQWRTKTRTQLSNILTPQ